MNATHSVDNKYFQAGVAMTIGFFVAPLVLAVTSLEHAQAQVPPEILYERQLQRLESMPEKRFPQPAAVTPEAPPTSEPKPAVKPPPRPPLKSRAQVEREIQLTQEELNVTEADISVIQAEIADFQARKDANNIRQMNREMELRRERIRALEKKKAALIRKIDSLNRQIGLLR
ncbi:MAG: hypothetical protein FJ118_14655 [Deltaproteobacteria bacterium]|nr:hypothetical protein [Deltaproteobacteria bacterium]